MTENLGLSRRQFLRFGCRTLLGGLLGGLSFGLYARFGEPGWLQVVKTEVAVSSLPPALAGLTMGQLSDLHVGSAADAGLVKDAVRLLNAASPDLVVLSGDFVTGAAVHGAAAAKALADLRAPYGVYAILGNHDVWTDADTVVAHLEGVGIPVLRDARRRVTVADATLWLLGIEDRGYTGFSSPGEHSDFALFRRHWQDAGEVLRTLLADIPTADPRLLLVHNPDFTEMLPAARVDLALSGHTHGGQVQIPLLGAPFVPSCFGQTFVGGLLQGTQTQVYVSRGVGTIPPAVRFNCRPEVTVVTLTRRGG